MKTIDVILPIGKPGAPTGNEVPELTRYDGQTLIDWAVREAVQARANRILLVAPEGHAPAQMIARHLWRSIRSHKSAAVNGRLRMDFLFHPVTDEEGWDGVVRAAALQCRGDQALLIDPTIALTTADRIVPYASFTLRKVSERIGDMPLCALAELPWDEALSMPVVTGPGLAPADDVPGSDRLKVFAGRAVLPLPLPRLARSATGAFPFDTLISTLHDAQVQPIQLLLKPRDARFVQPGEAAKETGPDGQTDPQGMALLAYEPALAPAILNGTGFAANASFRAG
ncbi:hypothetical protein [Szabonella alba]|uniref:Uncharacterized protein n=1 Tax=Szabonella alba TaxID=2804194 RepID=A0A8K0Y1N1_9RHOB|nr:hypothetical protein [Szabonella alba]MBL4919036.1 hypothetical protein [Szabonella alba]